MNTSNVLNQIKQTINLKVRQFEHFATRWFRRLSLVSIIVAIIVSTVSVGTILTLIPHAHNIYSAAKLVDGESRGEPIRGQKAVFASLLERRDHPQFPDTFHAVAYQPYSNNERLLQYNAMGDHLHEDLSTELGQQILLRTTWWYALDRLGLFIAPTEAQGAHSYCVPSACQRQSAYFGNLQLVGLIGNHEFYRDRHEDDVVYEPVVIADLAPTESLRPRARPNSITQRAPHTSVRPKVRPTGEAWDAIVRSAAVRAALEEAVD